jgi:cell division protein FtsI/penicillin-binding protein 2
VQDATLAQVSAVTARRSIRAAGRRRRAGADAALSRDAGGASVRLRRRGERRAGVRQRRLKSGDIVGQSGIEKVYNAQLMGDDGAKRVVVNSVGREIRTLEEDEPTEGKRLQLTLDYDVQKAIEDGFDQLGFNGAPSCSIRATATCSASRAVRRTIRTRSPPASIARRGRR